MKTTREWEDKNAIWAYGSRLGEGRVGAATVWWKKEGPRHRKNVHHRVEQGGP